MSVQEIYIADRQQEIVPLNPNQMAETHIGHIDNYLSGKTDDCHAYFMFEVKGHSEAETSFRARLGIYYEPAEGEFIKLDKKTDKGVLVSYSRNSQDEICAVWYRGARERRRAAANLISLAAEA